MAMNNAVPTFESLLEFQEVYLRAVALAWKDAEFLAEIQKDARQALANYFGYICPWNLDLEFEQVTGDEFAYKPGHEIKVPLNTITVGIPKKPALVEQEAVALAAYNDSGPAYLFTCC